ncbi:hypothetical protein OIU77_003715 [Salix suchowensis]|uniref:Uncharacterized protein n=1 Tax=Salix suchowensis TaxID=1278906 RepID=A0ABQ9AU65_9ROSI|nr:hypothetical protein OIU77_003715 [Salix suchowensis]KAJ6359558.1 hypothetical protein OIU77_003715 [Salix suchowensis]
MITPIMLLFQTLIRVTALSRTPILKSSSLLTPASTGIADSRLRAMFAKSFSPLSLLSVVFTKFII